LFAEVTPTPETVKKSEPTVNTKPVSSPSVSNNTTSSTTSTTIAPTSTPVKESVAKAETKTVTHEEKVTTTPSTTSTGFIIQAGYFGSETNAQKCLADLKAKGFTQFSIKPLQQTGSTFYRVWSTDFATEKDAQAKLQQLSAAGIKGTVKSNS
jgi:cell division protein FtsN